ncbi:hypothetical protein Vretifemale_15916, partial [Volvox reticuliferus]
HAGGGAGSSSPPDVPAPPPRPTVTVATRRMLAVSLQPPALCCPGASGSPPDVPAPPPPSATGGMRDASMRTPLLSSGASCSLRASWLLCQFSLTGSPQQGHPFNAPDGQPSRASGESSTKPWR